MANDWRDTTWIAFDTETTGRYPVESEICEIAAVKWKDGKEIETFQSLIKPSRKMGQEVIRIHGITNEMVADAPAAGPVLRDFKKFIEGGTLLAHHAQFDLGFVAAQMEDFDIELPPELTICTSLLAQGTIPETPNHRLQTLAAHYGIDPGQAHRALDDARACLLVALRIFERLSENGPLTVSTIAEKMLRRTANDLGPLKFARFSLRELKTNPHLSRYIEAARAQQIVEMVYRGGSRPGQPRKVLPIGVIRQLDGDALVASEIGEDGKSLSSATQQSKRYWVKDVTSIV
ncbi:MAG: 3'-5' exonuclease [Bdellovibrionales bacterium]|nr:3'-5' exonuclease [Bdellovibrionales bacterium]